MGWGALLWGETVSDWLDGPLARRRGGTTLGGALDLEADSWLTFWAAWTAVRLAGLPPWYGLAPSLHYLLLWFGPSPSNDAPPSILAPCARPVGVAQMAVASIALCPWSNDGMERLARRMAPVVAGSSVLCLIAEASSRRRAVHAGCSPDQP
jgi:hypothetical protein